MAKGKLEVPYVVPKEQLGAFRLRLEYGRRLGSSEVFIVDRSLFLELFAKGFSLDKVLDHRIASVHSVQSVSFAGNNKLPAFVLLAAELLPSVFTGHIHHRLALLTLRVRRTLPPYQSVQRYLVGESIKGVMASFKLPKRERKPKVVVAARARRLVSLEG